MQRVVDLVRQAPRQQLQRAHALRQQRLRRRVLRLEQRAHRRHQLVRAEGLREVGVGPGLEALEPVVLLVEGE